MRGRPNRTFFEVPHASVYVLVILNIATYFLCLNYSGTTIIPTELLFRNGAMYSGAIARHEYWRLVAYGFLHADLLHLTTNMICLALWGGHLENRIGSTYFVLVYVCALVAGGLIGDFTHSREYLMVGASGAISGVLGALLSLWILAKIDLSANFFVINIGLNVALALSSSRIDWGAHFGGFAAGFIFCALLDVIEKANRVVFRCKFPEFVKINCLVIGGALAIYFFESKSVGVILDQESVVWLLICSIVFLVIVKFLDLLLSFKKGLAVAVIIFAMANSALALFLARAFTPVLKSRCAGLGFEAVNPFERIFAMACASLDLTIDVAAASAFVLTILAYRPELYRGIKDVGFVGASLRAERQRRHGI